MEEPVTAGASQAPVEEKRKKGLGHYFGQYSSKDWWSSLLKYIIEVGTSKLLIAFAEAFAGTLVWHVKERGKKLPDISPITQNNNNVASGVFSGGYATPSTQGSYTSPNRNPPATNYSHPAGFSQGSPFDSFGR